MAQIINASYNSLPQQVEENKNNIAKSNVDITTANTNIAKNTSDITTANTNIAKNAIDITSANANITKNTSDITTANTNITSAKSEADRAYNYADQNYKRIQNHDTRIKFNFDNMWKNTNNIIALSSCFVDEMLHKSGSQYINTTAKYSTLKPSSFGVNWNYQTASMTQGAGITLKIGHKFEEKHLYEIILTNTTKNIDGEFDYNIFCGYIDTISWYPLDKQTGSTLIFSPQIFCEVFNYKSVNSADSDGCTFEKTDGGNTYYFKRLKNISKINLKVVEDTFTNIFIPCEIAYDITQSTHTDKEVYVTVIDKGVVNSLT